MLITVPFFVVLSTLLFGVICDWLRSKPTGNQTFLDILNLDLLFLLHSSTIYGIAFQQIRPFITSLNKLISCSILISNGFSWYDIYVPITYLSILSVALL